VGTFDETRKEMTEKKKSRTTSITTASVDNQRTRSPLSFDELMAELHSDATSRLSSDANDDAPWFSRASNQWRLF
jgi:hypothetical protein